MVTRSYDTLRAEGPGYSKKRQLFRDRLLDCTTEKMRACAEKYLVGKKPALAIVGGAQAAEALAGDGWVVTDAEGKPLE